MNFKESIRPLIKYWWILLLAVVVTMGGIYVSNMYSGISYDGSTTLILKQSVTGPEIGEDYKYDGFYTVQANQMFSDSIETWLEAPDFVNLIYAKAELNAPVSMNALKNLFDFDKVISQSVAVRINTGNQDEASKLMNAMILVMKERTESVLMDKNGAALFTLDSTPVLVLPHEADYKLQYGAGLIGGIGMGMFLAYFMVAFEDEKKKKK